MNPLLSLYPATPVGVPLSATNPSANFKKEVKKVLLSIVLFFIVYVLLIIAAIVLAIACLYAGAFVMFNSGHLIGIIAGLGIMSIGIMVFIFLIKFIFSVKKYDESGTITVTEAEQPVLFGFIRQLTADTQTPFPKKIVLSPEVNASVFYNDSFWSMIFPVRKNLQIGLGLVNCLTLSEFKAVMAHEFGHFSQRSMKLGSFVYNVNKAVYNMLYENKSYSNFLEKFGNLHWAIGIFVWVTIQIVKGIQQVLQGMYSFINKNYMGLSREMEFHADAVAASVSGSNSLVTALQKLEISDVCYQTVIQKADELVQEKTRLQNIYSNHDEVMEAYALHNHLPLQNKTPLADEEFFKKFQYHKINITNQWASHPPREERNAHLQELAITAENDTRPAWTIFTKPEALQQQLSDVVYRTVPANLLEQQMNAAAFREKYRHDINTYTLPARYNGYYDDRQVNQMDLAAVFSRDAAILPPGTNFNSLFSDDWIGLNKKLAGNRQDIETLEAITGNRIRVKTFDYAGEKMTRSAAPALLEQLKAELATQEKLVQEHEENIALFFYQAAQKAGGDKAASLKQRYQNNFDNRKRLADFIGIGQHIMDLLSPLLSNQTVSIEQAEHMARSLRAETENLRPLVKAWLQQGSYAINSALQSKAEELVQGNYRYFANPNFIDSELGTLHSVISETPSIIADVEFKQFKELLSFQLELAEQAKETAQAWLSKL